MILSVAVDKNFGIGKNNELLVFLPEDLEFFKQLTVNKAIVIGRKTLESFKGGHPLPKRLNVVLTRNGHYDHERIMTMDSLEALLEWTKGKEEDEVIVAGGGEVYRLLMPYCSKLHITMIDGDFDADTFIDHPRVFGFRCVIEEPMIEYKGVFYRHTIWQKKKQ